MSRSTVDIRTINIRERFDCLVEEMKADFKDAYGGRLDFEWSPDYLRMRRNFFLRFKTEFALPREEMDERLSRLQNVITCRLKRRRQKAVERGQVAPGPDDYLDIPLDAFL